MIHVKLLYPLVLYRTLHYIPSEPKLVAIILKSWVVPDYVNIIFSTRIILYCFSSLDRIWIESISVKLHKNEQYFHNKLLALTASLLVLKFGTTVNMSPDR